MRDARPFLAAAVLACGLVAQSEAAPRIRFSVPLVGSPGTSTVTLYGNGLEAVKNVRFDGTPPESAEVALKSQETWTPPKDVDPERFGDGKAVIELKLPDGFGGNVSLVVESDLGASKPFRVPVRADVLDETEPNDGYASAQPIAIGQPVRGVIEKERDVDVFAFEPTESGDHAVGVEANENGAPTDPFLTLLTAEGVVLRSLDDAADSRDPAVTASLEADRRYLVSVVDANDAGSGVHAYVLRVERARPDDD